MSKSKPDVFRSRGDFAEAMIIRYGIDNQNDIVSDIGAGFGFMREFIEGQQLVWQPFDYYKKIEASTVWDLNHPAPESSKSAGTVIMLEVLEHLANPFMGLKHISDHMDQGAHLILTTPNPRSSKNKLNLLIKGELYAFQKHHLDEHHVFTPWRHIVEFFLNQVGLKPVYYAIVDDNYSRLKPKGFKEFIKFRIERFLEKRDPFALGMSYGIVAKKESVNE